MLLVIDTTDAVKVEPPMSSVTVAGAWDSPSVAGVGNIVPSMAMTEPPRIGM